MPSKKRLKITLIKSPIGTQPRHKACVKGLGLRRLRQAVVVLDNPSTRGMINKVSYLLSVEEI
jgi:large subunit ribosomal protein L30